MIGAFYVETLSPEDSQLAVNISKRYTDERIAEFALRKSKRWPRKRHNSPWRCWNRTRPRHPAFWDGRGTMAEIGTQASKRARVSS